MATKKPNLKTKAPAKGTKKLPPWLNKGAAPVDPNAPPVDKVEKKFPDSKFPPKGSKKKAKK
jgi:hypothetical protein